MNDRKLAAIMFADIVSYSRLMGSNESEAFKLLNDFEEMAVKIVDTFSGTIIKKNGDQVFCEFSSAKNAVDASLELQNKLGEYNDSRPKDFKLEVRIGIHIGDVVKREDGDIHGDGVNVAARIQPLASPGGICISGAVSDAISSHPDYDVISKGEQELKNILHKHSIFQVKTGHESIEAATPKKTKEKSSNVKYWLLASPFILILFIFLMNKLAFSIMGNMMKMEATIADSENNPNILLFGDVFSDPDNISDIRVFYERGKDTTLPDDVSLLPLLTTELNDIYDEVLSSIQGNLFIGDLEIHTKYDLDKFYKEKNDLVPDYKIKSFNMLRKMAAGELDLSKISDPNSEAFKLMTGQMENSDIYIMGQYHRIGLGYFPIIYKLSRTYNGADYLVVGHIKYDQNPTEDMNIDSKWEMQLVAENNMVDELSEMLLTLLNQVMKRTNKIGNYLDRTLEVTRSSGDKLLFKKHLLSESSTQNNKLNKLKPRMIFEVMRFYLHKPKDEIIDKATLEAVAKERLNDLQGYKDRVDKNKDSKQYIDFYNRDHDFPYGNIIEYEALLNKTHTLNTATGSVGNNITFVMPLGITVKIDEVFDSTGSATIYEKDNPFEVLKEGDILIRK